MRTLLLALSLAGCVGSVDGNEPTSPVEGSRERPRRDGEGGSSTGDSSVIDAEGDAARPEVPDERPDANAEVPDAGAPDASEEPGRDASPPDRDPPEVPIGTTTLPELDADLERIASEGHAPGLAASIVTRDGIAWTFAWGYSDIEHGVEVTPSTSFMLASVSKTVTATCVMQGVDRGELTLDGDVNDVLPFRARNPRHDDVAITLRMLLSHTSSIIGSDAAYPPYSRGDSPVALGDFLRRYLEPGGDLYGLDNFAEGAPGATWAYGDIDIALAAYLAEAASDRDFARLCHDELFAPLGMTNTAYHLADLGESEVALPYQYRDGEQVTGGHYGYPDYPDGGLRTSAIDFGKFLVMTLNRGELGGVRVVSEATMDEMFTQQYAELEGNQLLGWRGSPARADHHGGDEGVSTNVFLDRENGFGLIVMINGEISGDAAIEQATAAVRGAAEALVAEH